MGLESKGKIAYPGFGNPYVFSVLLAFALAPTFKLACACACAFAFAFPLTLFLCTRTVLHRVFPQPRAFVIDQRKGEGKGEGKGKGKFEGKGKGKGKGLDAKQVQKPLYVLFVERNSCQNV